MFEKIYLILKEEKKKFDRETERVCGLVESHLKTSHKKKDTILQEVIIFIVKFSSL